MENKLGYSLKNSFNNHRFHTDEYVLENKNFFYLSYILPAAGITVFSANLYLTLESGYPCIQ